jgi:DNA-binding NarL/FixJ family response regulator
MDTIRMLVVEDHDVMRFGLVMLLNREKDVKVVAEAGDGHTALRLLETTPVDVVLVDLVLPDMEGLQLIKLIQTRFPRLAVIVATMHDELRYGDRAIAAGARGYVMKSAPPTELLRAIREVAAGGMYISNELKDRLAIGVAEEGPRPYAQRIPLTDREIEVLGLLGRGFSSTEIAVRLHRSIKTIDAHRENIKKKLALKNANELLRYAVCWVEEESKVKPTGEDPLRSKSQPLGPTLPLPLADSHN